VTEEELFQLVRKVAEIVREYTNDGKRSLGDMSKDCLNPKNYQTKSGLFFELDYSKPYRIWTPWGAVTLVDVHGDWHYVLPVLLQRLGAEMYRPIRRWKLCQDGPVYKLTKVDEILLPSAIELEHFNYKNISTVLVAWERLKMQPKV